MIIDTVEIEAQFSRLTIAKDRAVLKFSKYASEELRRRQFLVAQHAVTKLFSPDMITRRGAFVPDSTRVNICLYVGKSRKDPVFVYEPVYEGIIFKPGWLVEQLAKASNTVNGWSKIKQEAMRINKK